MGAVWFTLEGVESKLRLLAVMLISAPERVWLVWVVFPEPNNGTWACSWAIGDDSQRASHSLTRPLPSACASGNPWISTSDFMHVDVTIIQSLDVKSSCFGRLQHRKQKEALKAILSCWLSARSWILLYVFKPFWPFYVWTFTTLQLLIKVNTIRSSLHPAVFDMKTSLWSITASKCYMQKVSIHVPGTSFCSDVMKLAFRFDF